MHYSTRPDVAPATSLARSSIRHLGEELLQRQAVLDGYGSTFFNMSPGWHSSASQMAASVENRTARTLPVLIRDRFTLVIPTRCDSLLSDTPRSSMISSSSMTMAMSVYPSTLRPDHDTTSCSKCSHRTQLRFSCWLQSIENTLRTLYDGSIPAGVPCSGHPWIFPQKPIRLADPTATASVGSPSARNFPARAPGRWPRAAPGRPWPSPAPLPALAPGLLSDRPSPRADP